MRTTNYLLPVAPTVNLHEHTPIHGARHDVARDRAIDARTEWAARQRAHGNR